MESTKFKLTIETSDCIPLLKPLWLALHDHHIAVAPFKGNPRTYEESWQRRQADYNAWIQDERTFVVLAWVADRPVGYAFVRIIAEDSTSWQGVDELAELETLVVLPKQRGSGVGQALIDRVIVETRELGLTELALVVIAGNDKSIEFYEANGFKPQEIQMKRKI